MKIEEFLKFDTAKLHRELTNILLIATEESNYHYCYCSQKNNSSKCALCRLCSFLYIRTDRSGFIEGLPPKKFLQKFYKNRVKLVKFLNLILPFFKEMSSKDERTLEFFDKEYEWSLRNYQEGTYSTMTLDEIINSDKQFVKYNPNLFDVEFIKQHPNYY